MLYATFLYFLASILAISGFLDAAPASLEIVSSELSGLSSSNELDSRAPVTLTLTKQNRRNAWTGSMPPGFYTRGQAPLYAQQGYELMKTYNPSAFELDANGKFIHGMLVACLYIPRKGFFLGTNPGKLGFYYDKDNAPTWWHQVQNRKILINGRALWHAEDVAMVTYEISLTTKLSPTATYPPGSFMAVFGHFQDETPGTDVPGPKSVCGQTGAETIEPSCYTVLSPSHLNVGF